MVDAEAERLWRECAMKLGVGNFVTEAQFLALHRTAEGHDLNFEELYEWANNVCMEHAMLETIEEGKLDVVGQDEFGQWLFRATKEGVEQGRRLMETTEEGKAFVERVDRLTKEDEQIIDADLLE